MEQKNLSNQVYRTSAMANIDTKVQLGKSAISGVTYEIGDNGLARITLSGLPAGSAPEIWQQTELAFNANGFKAMAFVKESPTDTPEIMITFPGNTGNEVDIANAKKFIAGESMYSHCKDTQNFIGKLSERLRTDYPDGNIPKITIGTHSMGVMSGIGANVELHENLGNNIQTETVMLEPVGAGLALEQWALYKTAQDKFGGNLSESKINELSIDKSRRPEIHDTIREYGRQMGVNCHSVLSDDDTIFRLKLGKNINHSASVGEVWRFRSPDNGLVDKINDHTIEAFATSLKTHGVNALFKDEEDIEVATDQILEGGRALTDWEYMIEQIKTALFTLLQSLSNDFKNNSSVFTQNSSKEDAKPENTKDLVAKTPAPLKQDLSTTPPAVT